MRFADLNWRPATMFIFGYHIVLLTLLPIYFYYQARNGWRDFGRQLRGASWLMAYLPTIAFLSCIGSSKFGGHDYIPYGWDLVVVALVSLVFYAWGLRCGWRTPDVANMR